MRKQDLSGGQKSGLIVLEGDNVVGSLFIEKFLHGLILSMQGIHFHQPPFQVDRFDQLAQGGDFVGLAGHGHHAQTTQGRHGDGGDQMHAAMVESLAIHGDQFPPIHRA